MKASDAYSNLLRELDKFESPTFTIGDFNYFYNVAISKYLTDNYGDFDVLQKDLDDIKGLLKYDESLDFVETLALLPDGYRHILNLELKLKFVKDIGDYVIDDIINVFPKRLATNRKGYTADNAYQQPSPYYTTYQLDGTHIHAYIGSEVIIENGKMDYIENPITMFLNPDRTVDYTIEVNNTTLQFPDYVNYEIITACRLIVLENIESQRYQSSLQDVQLEKSKQ